MGTEEWLMLIGGIILLLGSIAAVIFSVKSGKRINKVLSAGLSEVSEQKARVKELFSEDVNGNKNYFVIFENEANEEIKISVCEEIFSDFKKNESGLLTLSDGELLSFVIEEET